MCSSDEKTDTLQLSANHQRYNGKVNHCIPGILSKCGAGTCWVEQRDCKFAIKSEFVNKCMYFIAAIDAHCDSPDAQKAAMKVSEKKGIS